MTWHIFNSDGHHIGTCDHEPNHEDLADRGETAYYYQHNGRGTLIVKDDAVAVIPPAPSRYHVLQDSEWVLTTDAAAKQLADVKAAKLAEINRAAQACIDQAAGLNRVPEFEVATWTIQALEAKAWHADNAAATPTLDAIAAARGVPVDMLKQKAYEKAVKFEMLTAHIAGLRQAAEDKIYAAKTPEDVAAVQCDFCTTTPSQTTTTEVVDE